MSSPSLDDRIRDAELALEDVSANNRDLTILIADRTSRGESTDAFEATLTDSKGEEALLRAELIILRSQLRRLLRSTAATPQASQSSTPLPAPGASGLRAPFSPRLDALANTSSTPLSGQTQAVLSLPLKSPELAMSGRVAGYSAPAVLPRPPKRQASPLPTLESQPGEDNPSQTTPRARVVPPKCKRVRLGALPRQFDSVEIPPHPLTSRAPSVCTSERQHQAADERDVQPALQTVTSLKGKSNSTVVPVVKSGTSRTRAKERLSDLYGREAPAAILGLVPSIFTIPSQDDLGAAGRFKCLNCIRCSRECKRVPGKARCNECENKKIGHCTFAAPAPLFQYQAEAVRYIALSSETYLAERLRNVTALHTSISALHAHLEMTEAQYRSQVLNIAYDLRLARDFHQDDMGFWEDSGLATSAAQAQEIFDFVDEYIASAPIQDAAQAAEEAYRLHGLLLNLLGHLHGDAPINWPGMPGVTPWPNPELPPWER